MNIRNWHDILPEWLTLPDAKDAVKNHHQTSTEYLKPAHIIQYVQQLRTSRKQNAPTPELPGELNQTQERAWTLTFWDAVKRGDLNPQTTADNALNVHRQIETAQPHRLNQIMSAQTKRTHT